MAEEGAKPEDLGEKCQTGTDSDLSNGPIKKRSCTDVIFLLLFPAGIAAFVVVTMMGFEDGNPHQLYLPRDYAGGYCSVEKQWNSEMSLVDFPWSATTMNVTSVIGEIIKTGVCSPTTRDLLANANAFDSGTFDMTRDQVTEACDIQSFNFSKYTDWESSADSFSDPNKAMGAFSDAGSIFGEATKYFINVCVTKCGLAQIKADANADSYREYKYTPGGDEKWLPVFNMVLALSDSTDDDWKEMGDLIKKQTTFKAWSKSVCPYPPAYCVPYPGMNSTEAPGQYCIQELEGGIQDGLVASAGGKAEEVLNGMTDLQGEASEGAGELIGELVEVAPCIAITGIVGIVVGIIFLIFLRFCIDLIVWVALIAVGLAFALLGLLCILRAAECKDEYSMSTEGLLLSAPQNVGDAFNPTCENGFKMDSEELRTGLQICGYVFFGIGGLWYLLMICLSCRIRLACAVNKAASVFLVENPHSLLFPVIQTAISLCWTIAWVFSASFLVSQVPVDYIPIGPYKTWAEPGATDGTGLCVNMYPAGSVYKDLSEKCLTEGLCWKCAAPRYVFDYAFLLSLFVYLWVSAFLVACTQTIVAGAVGVWFFTDRKESSTLKQPVFAISIKNAFLYHIGSMAFGAFILAIVQTIKWALEYLKQQAKAQKNKIMEIIIYLLQYLIICFEKCVKFMNKNAYIQVALRGTNFCRSAKNAFQLILRNAVRFWVVTMLSWMVHFLGFVFITAATAILGYLILMQMYPEVNPIAPTLIFVFMGAVIASIYMAVFGLAVDTTLQAFIIAEELGCADKFVPPALQSYMEVAPKGDEGKRKGCCACLG